MAAATTLEGQSIGSARVSPAASQGTPSLHSLPTELIERVLLFSDPRDVLKYAQTCRFARKLVLEPKDHFLWRELYLGRPFDDLRHTVAVPLRHPILRSSAELSGARGDTTTSSPWLSELLRRMEAEAIAASSESDPGQLQRAFETFLAAIEAAAPVREDEIGADGKTVLSRSENLHWLNRLLRRTHVLNQSITLVGADGDANGNTTSISSATRSHARGGHALDASVEAFRQLRCQLRAFVALSHENSFVAESRVRMAEIRKSSRCFVYDMRKYKAETLWGPYRTADESCKPTLVVNWEHVEHIMNVVGLKLREVSDVSLGYYKKSPFTLEALRAYSAIGSFERPPQDWAGVTGQWRRFVCFMDYRSVYSHLPPGPHHPSFFEAPFDEALRPVELYLSLITESEYLSDPSQIPHVLPPDPPVTDEAVDDPAFPTLYFEGRSRGPHASVASIRGRVSTLADGAIRWQFVTTYDGRMQWSAEGVQLGHVCSAAGIAGIWTGAHHQRDDPAGPFWMVKVNDQLPDGVLNSLH
ncbi:hypothetical protein PYCCODRAFT_1405781 [Trametes coccinea BRFM310]|uniref:F-box domain-containing protein n=1 Tax=Trametes coccinea (strain BRFM310) TaxID=1353009 RepID=A0A1Y2IXK1_TRAC3|nr:hypothetical protein PYCCODRAFT_1405781 [Trametes coccinea BRFM310]